MSSLPLRDSSTEVGMLWPIARSKWSMKSSRTCTKTESTSSILNQSINSKRMCLLLDRLSSTSSSSSNKCHPWLHPNKWECQLSRLVPHQEENHSTNSSQFRQLNKYPALLIQDTLLEDQWSKVILRLLLHSKSNMLNNLKCTIQSSISPSSNSILLVSSIQYNQHLKGLLKCQARSSLQYILVSKYQTSNFSSHWYLLLSPGSLKKQRGINSLPRIKITKQSLLTTC